MPFTIVCRWYPAGVCIHELATMIHTALKWAPKATMHVAKKCMRGPTLFHPNSKIARKPDSRKKAKIPSAASALPKMSPTKREYVDQFVPNSNSITIPVATPMAKVSAKMRVQNRAMLWKSGFPVLSHIASIITRIMPKPMLNGG